MSDSVDPPRKLSTRLIHTGRDPSTQDHAVNPPLHRASTLIMPRAEDLYAPGIKTYGIHGMQVHDALKDALCNLENASHCTLTESGLLACTLPIFALCEAGGHVLIPDNVYGPTRRYCDRSLKRTGGSVTYYSPDIGAGIADLIQENTRLILLESPGSLTFEIPDTIAITDAARARNVPTAMDNSWAAGVYLHPLDMGVDISILATTKYASGHSDCLSGAILTNDAVLAAKMNAAAADLGLSVAPEDASLVLRGLRTMPLRLAQHEASALEIAEWLSLRPEVDRVLHPGLPSDKYYKLWRRDFTGASGLFSFVLRPYDEQAVLAFLNALTLFGLGFSYGGYESLAIHCDPQLKRAPSHPAFAGPLIRLSVGLEAPDDLKQDLKQGFAALNAST